MSIEPHRSAFEAASLIVKTPAVQSFKNPDVAIEIPKQQQASGIIAMKRGERVRTRNGQIRAQKEKLKQAREKAFRPF